MAKLYYGNNHCSIESEGATVKGIEIRYNGAIYVKDQTSEHYTLNAKNNGIIVFPVGKSDLGLSSLFTYRGDFEITSVIVADQNAEQVETTIHKVMDYSELMDSNAEDITNLSENLKSEHRTGKKPKKTVVVNNFIKNLNTSDFDGKLFLEDGTHYQGDFHIDKNTGTPMTGKLKTKDSKDLYFKKKNKGDQLFSTSSNKNIGIKVYTTPIETKINKFKKSNSGY